MKILGLVTFLVILFFAFNVYAQDLIKAGEKAEYSCFMGGKDAGYFKVNITKAKKGMLNVSGETKVLTPMITLLNKGECKVTPDIKFQELSLEIEVSGAQNATATVECTFKDNNAHIIIEGQQSAEKDIELKGDYLVIPSNVMEYFYLALKKFLSQEKDKMVYLTLIPTSLVTVNTSFTKKGNEKIKLGKKEVEAVHVIMGIGPQLIDFWADPKTGSMLKLSIAAQKFEMILKI
ncbi:hypothetical protein DRQ09_07130 [candidate division KSB1 bacterium]|nr:MAG: hypothetical protein DRQ09_07130 [candidate division KSB1 bacterium]